MRYTLWLFDWHQAEFDDSDDGFPIPTSDSFSDDASIQRRVFDIIRVHGDGTPP